MKKLILNQMNLKNQKVLMRVDFNVPIKEGKILDDTRIVAALETIQYILDQGASLILMSHLGKPKGKKEEGLSLAPCAKRLEEKLNIPVKMAKDCIGKEVQELSRSLRNKEILFLENLRFHEAEEHPEKDPSFAKELASLGTCYVDDAFGAAHRNHASIVGVPSFFPKSSAMGFLMQKEVAALSGLRNHPKRPFYAIIGGAKVSSKIGLISELLKRVDALFIGGAMSFSFLKARGVHIEDPLIEKVEEIQKMGLKKLRLPLDLVMADSISEGASFETVSVDQVPSSLRGVDVGPLTIESWVQELQGAAQVFWNGPVGVFEVEAFSKGTETLAKALAKMGEKVVVGGGDSVFAIRKMGLEKNFAHLSTGGGASLEFLEKGSLPGILSLSSAP